jgi:hypothetical protein
MLYLSTAASSILLAVLAGTEAPSASCGEDGDGAAVLEKFLARPDEPLTSYRSRRRMFAQGLGKEASMEVLVQLDTRHGFRFEVLAEEGSELIRNRGFRAVLEAEKEAYESGRSDRAALTADNYALRFDGREPDGLVRLRARPLRQHKALIDGAFLVTPESADIVRVEGRLAKGPSFWTPRMDIVRHYRRLRGHRVLVRVESVGHVRLLGDVQCRVEYEYETIEGDRIPPLALPWLTASSSSGLDRPSYAPGGLPVDDSRPRPDR